MNYDDLTKIAMVAKRWERNSDPAMAYIRQLTRHNFLCASYQYWSERGYHSRHWIHRDEIEQFMASGRAENTL